MRRLQHTSDCRMQPELRTLAGIFPIDQDAAGCRFIKAANQVGKARFPRSRLADNRKICAERNLQGKMVQNGFIPVRIAEADVSQFDISPNWFPVLPSGRKTVPVTGDYFLGIPDIRLCREQLRISFNVHLPGNQIRNDVYKPPHRFHHSLCIGHKHGKCADI